MSPIKSEAVAPPVWRRAFFYLGGTLPPRYATWIERKLSSRWRYLVQHIVGSLSLFVCTVIPLSLLLGLDRDEVERVSLMTVAGLLVGSIILSERFRRHSMERHGLRPNHR